MTLAELRALAERLPPGASLSLPREALLDLCGVGNPGAVESATSAPRAEPAHLLTTQEVAARLHTSARWVYANAGAWPFARRVGRLVRFDAAGFERWLSRANGT